MFGPRTQVHLLAQSRRLRVSAATWIFDGRLSNLLSHFEEVGARPVVDAGGRVPLRSSVGASRVWPLANGLLMNS